MLRNGPFRVPLPSVTCSRCNTKGAIGTVVCLGLGCGEPLPVDPDQTEGQKEEAKEHGEEAVDQLMAGFFGDQGWPELALRQRYDKRGRKRGSAKPDVLAREWDLGKVNYCRNRFRKAAAYGGGTREAPILGPTVADRLADDPKWCEQIAARRKKNPASVVAKMAYAVLRKR